MPSGAGSMSTFLEFLKVMQGKECSLNIILKLWHQANVFKLTIWGKSWMPHFLHLSENIVLKNFKHFFLGIKLCGSLTWSQKVGERIKFKCKELWNEVYPTLVIIWWIIKWLRTISVDKTLKLEYNMENILKFTECG